MAQTQIIAHRGYWKLTDLLKIYNSTRKADPIAVFGSEVDVWISRDGIPVVNHDESIFTMVIKF